MRPRPQWGQGWRKGGDHHVKGGFLQSKKNNCRIGKIPDGIASTGRIGFSGMKRSYAIHGTKFSECAAGREHYR